MADYTIVIHGTGHSKASKPHLSARLSSDELLDEFVKQLHVNGHIVEVATITHGGRETVRAD